jgi:hypothetical protein
MLSRIEYIGNLEFVEGRNVLTAFQIWTLGLYAAMSLLIRLSFVSPTHVTQHTIKSTILLSTRVLLVYSRL